MNFLVCINFQDAIASLPNAGLRLWPGHDPIGGGATPKIRGGAISFPSPMLAKALISAFNFFLFKYYQENPPVNNFHKDVCLRNHSYNETVVVRDKINYDMFMSVALSNPPTYLCSHSTNSSTLKWS